MSCQMAQTTAHGYFDGELDAVRAAEFELHLKNCPDCQVMLEHIGSLHTRLQSSNLYKPASARLRENLSTKLALNTAAARRQILALRPRLWLAMAAVLVVAAAVSLVSFFASSRADSARLTAELIDAHVRSLQPGHLTDVQSTDQHTVKPWFDGKLDFIPPVSDFSSQGFPLLGGRLDVIDGHNVAALVYGRSKHFINLFVWPAQSEKYSEGSGSRQGYNWVRWRSGDMEYFIASDTSAADLRVLRDLIRP